MENASICKSNLVTLSELAHNPITDNILYKYKNTTMPNKNKIFDHIIFYDPRLGGVLNTRKPLPIQNWIKLHKFDPNLPNTFCITNNIPLEQYCRLFSKPTLKYNIVKDEKKLVDLLILRVQFERMVNTKEFIYQYKKQWECLGINITFIEAIDEVNKTHKVFMSLEIQKCHENFLNIYNSLNVQDKLIIDNIYNNKETFSLKTLNMEELETVYPVLEKLHNINSELINKK